MDLKNSTGDSWFQEAQEAYFYLSERVDKIFIIGYSMGGVFASYIAQHFPVEKLVLIAPAFDHTRLTQLSKLHLTPRHFSEHMKLNMYHIIKKRLKDIPPKAFVEFKHIIEQKNPELEKIECQTLIVHGTIDLLVPYTSSISAAERIKNCQLELIEDAPHLFSFTEDKQMDLNITAERFLFAAGN